jgi:hypothetical protein
MSAWLGGLGSLGAQTGQAVVAAHQLRERERLARLAESFRLFQTQLSAERLAQEGAYQKARLAQEQRTQESLDAFRKATLESREQSQKTLDAYRQLLLEMRGSQPGAKLNVQLPDKTVTTGFLNPRTRELTDYAGNPLPKGSKVLGSSSFYPTETTGGVSYQVLDINGVHTLVAVPQPPRFSRKVPGGSTAAPPGAAAGPGRAAGRSSTEGPGTAAIPAGARVIGRKLTPQETTAVDVIHQGLPMIDRVIGLLAPEKSDNSLSAAARSRFNWQLYKHGIKVGEPWQSYIQVAALLRVMNTQQFLHGIRNMTFVQQIQQHMPNPETDTPAMAYEKAVRMKALMKQMLGEYTGAAPEGGADYHFDSQGNLVQ